ncbi:response regulator [Gemmatimonas groenlandica]|uniref:histidine kinase n=1 Tax=Gemmatimonas groenlandica TaxID=2732249 RepID=A0A6M4IV24_9BACT|nr:response regulator [Gemmatimonas groenlandica]QJR37609.1 response regulator [Gemmatimonas groenlandica]
MIAPTFSWAPVTAVSPSAARDRRTDDRRCRVLIVDDNPDDRASLRQMLLLGSERQFIFTEAELGNSALQMMRNAPGEDVGPCPFDCVLLDFNLPDMNAVEVLTALCGSDNLPPCPVVVITGWGGVSRGEGARLLGAGAQDYIGKSWTTADSLNRSLDNSIERFELLKRRNLAQQELRESEERYRNLFDSLNECLFVVEKLDVALGEPVDFRYVSFNPAFLAQSEIRGEIGLTMRQLLPDDFEEWFSTCDRVCSSGVPVRFEHDVPNTERVLELYAFRLGGAESHRVAVIFWDITTRKQSELKVLAQADALAQADRRKDEFLAMLGHELRNPLAPLRSAVELLKLQYHDESQHPKALQIVERQVGQLTRLVEDLLDVSRVTTGIFQLRLDTCTIRQIVENAVTTTHALALERGQSLTVAIPTKELHLKADAARLEQVVVNLLNNAVKYTDAGGGIWLTVEEDGDVVVLRVRDTGIGIAPELLPRIFDLFSQAEQSLDRSEGGLGVGLSLVRRLVELHEGSIEVSSTLGYGSEFVVRLPLSAAPVERAPTQSPAKVAPVSVKRRVRILLVDDNVDAAESLGMLLTATGHDVRLAHDGQAALAVALAHPPQVVLLDIGLPLLDGYEVARRLRLQDGLSNVVIVATTGYGHARDRELSTSAGFDRHLLKPVNLAAVQNILSELIA